MPGNRPKALFQFIKYRPRHGNRRQALASVLGAKRDRGAEHRARGKAPAKAAALALYRRLNRSIDPNCTVSCIRMLVIKNPLSTKKRSTPAPSTGKKIRPGVKEDDRGDRQRPQAIQFRPASPQQHSYAVVRFTRWGVAEAFKSPAQAVQFLMWNAVVGPGFPRRDGERNARCGGGSKEFGAALTAANVQGFLPHAESAGSWIVVGGRDGLK